MAQEKPSKNEMKEELPSSNSNSLQEEDTTSLRWYEVFHPLVEKMEPPVYWFENAQNFFHILIHVLDNVEKRHKCLAEQVDMLCKNLVEMEEKTLESMKLLEKQIDRLLQADSYLAGTQETIDSGQGKVFETMGNICEKCQLMKLYCFRLCSKCLKDGVPPEKWNYGKYVCLHCHHDYFLVICKNCLEEYDSIQIYQSLLPFEFKIVKKN